MYVQNCNKLITSLFFVCYVPHTEYFLCFVVNRTEAQKDIHRASLMWSPLKEDQQKHDEGIAFHLVHIYISCIDRRTIDPFIS